MTVSEFIDWLKTQDQGATVEVVKVIRGHGYNGDSHTSGDFTPDDCHEYIDFRGNRFVTDPALKDKRVLFLGER